MSTVTGYVMVPSQSQPESEDFFHRHWKMFLGLCLLVFLMPLLGSIVQILQAIFSLGSGFGEALKGLLGPFIKLLHDGEKQCEQNPNSWQCWVFKVSALILPIFCLILQRIGPRKAFGQLGESLKSLAGFENRSVLDIGKDIADTAEQDSDEALNKTDIPDNLKSDPKFQRVVAERMIAIRTRKSFQDFYSRQTDPALKKKAEEAAEQAQKDCDESEKSARQDIDDNARDIADKNLPPVPPFQK
jgi:hypothetical protein